MQNTAQTQALKIAHFRVSGRGIISRPICNGTPTSSDSSDLRHAAKHPGEIGCAECRRLLEFTQPV